MKRFHSLQKRIVFEDNHLLVLNKRGGELVQPAKANQMTTTPLLSSLSLHSQLKEYLRIKYSKPGNVYLGLVHRLDRLTSGLLVFAKTSKAAARLCRFFVQKDIRKNYLALVHGKVLRGGLCESYIDDSLNPVKVLPFSSHATASDYKYASLTYTPLEQFYSSDSNICTALAIELETGRKHQIRAQMSAIGHPILGDTKYRAKSWLPSPGYSRSHNPHTLTPLDLRFIGLHSYELSFPHPTTHQPVRSLCPSPPPHSLTPAVSSHRVPQMTFRAPLPQEWNGNVLAQEKFDEISFRLQSHKISTLRPADR
jgi:23S rRNA pseudouridine1911/1915/1917 synthase